QQAPENAMEAKAVNDAVAYIRSLAQMRGRNAEWAEQAVREAASLSASDALDRNVVDIVATSTTDLIAQIDGRVVDVNGTDVTLDVKDLELEAVDPDWRTELLAAITNPNVALILMMIGVYGLIFEFMNPGAIYPGTVGAICLIIGLYALAALPINYAGVALVILGLILIIAEAFAPSFGALGIGGVVAFVIGSAILVDTDSPAFSISWPVIVGTAGTALAFSLIVVRMAISSHRRQIVTGRDQMIGQAGVVQDWQGTAGHLFVHGERWRAESHSELKPGQTARIVSMDGLTLRVEPDQTEQA
ncbi:MAG: nodulation protein NfeD, partial [Rhodospirillaceae bacterium]